VPDTEDFRAAVEASRALDASNSTRRAPCRAVVGGAASTRAVRSLFSPSTPLPA